MMFSTRLPSALIERLKERCEEDDLAVPEFVEGALEAALDSSDSERREA